MVVRSEKASTTSYDGVVRDSGISRLLDSRPEPAGVIARYFLPSKVCSLTAAAVSSPSRVPPLTVNVTITWAFSRSTPVTWPTSTPAILTGSPTAMPPASVNAAW